MSDRFDPTQYLQNLEKRPNCAPRYYLPVNARVAWFRAEHPGGAIITTPETIGDVFYVRAQIIVDGEIRATGIAGVRSGKGTTWDGRELEKSETAAIGRALAHVGYGTLYALQDDDEDALSDAPVAPVQAPAQPATVHRLQDAAFDLSVKANFDRLMFESRHVEPNGPHRKAIIEKLLREGYFAGCATVEACIAVMEARPDKTGTEG